MNGEHGYLRNGIWADAIPAALARAQRTAVTRQLAGAHWLLRRKRDGRYLATADRHGNLQGLLPLSAAQRHSLSALLVPSAHACDTLAMGGQWQTLRTLGIAADYGRQHKLTMIAEPTCLAFAGHDRYQRPLWLLSASARAWLDMQKAARGDGIALDAISGFRSHAYQSGIFRRKLARGLSIADILAVNAAPGFSEHHGGYALDIGTPGEPAAEASFEHTPAFAWLSKRAHTFGFRLSFPRDNPHGIVYEPWHWAHLVRAGGISPASV